MNKKVKIRGQAYRMYQVESTGWVFVESKKARRTYDVAKIQDGEIVEVTIQDALSSVTNQELADAWLEQ